MTFSARETPWLLAVFGGIHGWIAGLSIVNARTGLACIGGDGPLHMLPSCPQGPTDEPLPILLSVALAAMLFVGAWVHMSRPPNEQRDLWAAGARVALSCVAFGLTPAVIAFFFGGESNLVDGLERRFHLAVAALAATGILVVPALPTALLLLFAVTRSPNPRSGSILAGADRAEHALAFLAAVALLPWWHSARPALTGWPLALIALAAIAIGVHAATLAREIKTLNMVFGNAIAGIGDMNSGDQFALDIGVGAEQRSLLFKAPSAYRSPARSWSIAYQGSPAEGAQAARRLVVWSLLVCVVALAQTAALLSRA